jgi:hypothetical protein
MVAPYREQAITVLFHAGGGTGNIMANTARPASCALGRCCPALLRVVWRRGNFGTAATIVPCETVVWLPFRQRVAAVSPLIPVRSGNAGRDY